VEVVVVTIPEKAVPSPPVDLFDDVASDVVIVDTGNDYHQRDGLIEEIEKGTTESRWVADQLSRPVVKAFNNVYAAHLLERGQAADSPGRIALPVAGDDAVAKAVVIQLVDELGCDGVDAGSLDESWRQQPARRCMARTTTQRECAGQRWTRRGSAGPTSAPRTSVPGLRHHRDQAGYRTLRSGVVLHPQPRTIGPGAVQEQDPAARAGHVPV
jgi:predicted dinucleotide-binding enzyme